MDSPNAGHARVPSPLTPGTTLIPRTKNKSNSTPHLPRAIAAAAPAENMLGFLIDAHEKRPGVEHELIREARDRERWLIFFLVCAGYAVLQTAARFPDEFDALTSFPASERQYYKALAWARAARRSLLNSLAALLAALLLERIRRRVARRGASSARKYERRRRQQRPRLPPELWAQVLGDFLPAQQVALLACCGGDVGAASASEETWRVVHRRDSGVVAAYSLPTAHAAHTVGDKPGAQSYKEAHSRLAASWAARAVLGGNVEGENVLVALRGAVYDLTRFAPDHPGSTDTLLDFAGAGPVPESSHRRRDAGRRTSARRRGGRGRRSHAVDVRAGTDASETFEAVGHSSEARRLAATLRVAGTLGGALASVVAELRRERAALAASSSHVCGACGLVGSRREAVLAYDARTGEWLRWWPCCGARPAGPPPPRRPWHKLMF